METTQEAVKTVGRVRTEALCRGALELDATSREEVWRARKAVGD